MTPTRDRHRAIEASLNAVDHPKHAGGSGDFFVGDVGQEEDLIAWELKQEPYLVK